MIYLPKEDWNYLQKHTIREPADTLYWGFFCFSRQDYSDVVKIPSMDEVTYGVYSTEGGTFAEMTMYWEYLQGELAPCLRVFPDAFLLLGSPTHQKLVKNLQTEMLQTFPPDEFSKLLIKMGFRDGSDRKLCG